MRAQRIIYQLLLIFLAVAQAIGAGLAGYSDLVVADRKGDAITDGLHIIYLGTNGYQFETGKHALLVDPYFSRLGVGAVLFASSIGPNAARIEEAMQHVAPKVDAILITHGHIDHLFDASPLMHTTGARLFASRTAVALAQATGAPVTRCEVVVPGDSRQIGPWKIRALAASHDRIFPIGVPFPGERKGNAPPKRVADWVCGQPLAFLIEARDRRIYIDSGGTLSVLPPNLGPVDLAILGTALPDSRARFASAVRRLHPRFILPSHQDNFLRPLNRGFVFGPLTNFPRVLRDYKQEQLPGKLILLDYFRPWTLP